MLEADGRNYLLTLAYFQRIPGCELYGVGNGDGKEMRAALEACDNNTLFNVLAVTIDLLLKRITPVRQNKRGRRALKFRRRNLRRALERTERRIAAHDAGTADQATAAVGADASRAAAG
jgi:hypothetical protein